MEDISNTHIVKRWWRFRTQSSLWANFLQNKYCKRAHCVTKVAISSDSHTWKSLVKIRAKIEPHIVWKIRSGNSSFWWDNWTGKGALAKIFPGIGRSAKLPVNFFFDNNSWNFAKLLNFLPMQAAQSIAQITIDEQNGTDFPIWQLSDDGCYTNKSAWHSIRASAPSSPFLNSLWHKRIPFKISFLNWRIFKRKVPFDDIIGKFGTDRRSMCVCCRVPTYETIQHFFVESEIAHQTWSFFGNPLGIRHTDQPIPAIFKKWMDCKYTNNVQKLILQVTPLIICWELWKQRCSCKYGNQRKINIGKILYHGIWTIKSAASKLFPPIRDMARWTEICYTIEKLRPITKWWQVLWEMPPFGTMKMNTDGSYITEKGTAGIGGILRDCRGDLIMAFSITVQRQ
ncbi:uncharacterized protein LOC132031659 [Lycium ferocissimum]|uniref:uncharacterized protein LOC132031659 n=1 Tax=Lycium ferocissimum TaxID=112874 RepID=UPI0028158BE5|nr:uncharacterized protein LOC132031659 [Lycium ferocissimum]